MTNSLRLARYFLYSWFLLLIGVHYVSQRPLWNDESCVLESLRELNGIDFFTLPLRSDQGFPRLYLWAIQQLSKAFDFHVLALRLLPFVAMIAAFLVWMRVARHNWTGPMARLNFCLCWCASIPLVYYAAELKQYSMDVLAASVFVYVLQKCGQGRLSPWVLTVLPLWGMGSYPALFLSWLPLFQLLRLRIDGKATTAMVWTVMTLWLLVLGWVYYFDWRVSHRELLETYWHDYFISFDGVGAFLKTLGEGLNNLIGRWFAEDPKWLRAGSRIFIGLGLLYMIVSFWGRWTKDRFYLNAVLTIAVLVLMELMVLGALRVFPFTVVRMSLFFAPFLVFAAVQSLEELRVRLPLLYWPLQVSFWVYLCYVSSGIAWEMWFGYLGAESALWV